MYAADALHPNPSLERKLQGLYQLRRSEDRISLGFRKPFFQLLGALGDPHLSLPPVIHVAGTNGKGSTVAFMRAMLEAEGYRVHVYTSPHLRRFNERIVLAGTIIGDDELERRLDETIAANAGRDVTFFEITTALAFKAFSDTPADVLLLEVGMGGRLDCTNVVPAPVLTVLTPIGYDHMEYLGDTLADIAGEKAGIMKRNVPCVVAPQTEQAQEAGVMDVFADRAAELDCPLYAVGRDTSLPDPALAGDHQRDNASTAAAAMRVLDETYPLLPVSADSIATGVRTARWPGRLERLDQTRFGLGPDWELWYDGGHNENAAQAIARQLSLWQEQDGKPVYLVLGMMANRNPADFVKVLMPRIARVYAVPLPEAKGHDPAILARAISDSLGTAVVASGSMKQALQAMPRETAGRVLVTGSLYLYEGLQQRSG